MLIPLPDSPVVGLSRGRMCAMVCEWGFINNFLFVQVLTFFRVIACQYVKNIPREIPLAEVPLPTAWTAPIQVTVCLIILLVQVGPIRDSYFSRRGFS